jgi:hypothetical protein
MEAPDDGDHRRVVQGRPRQSSATPGCPTASRGRIRRVPAGGSGRQATAVGGVAGGGYTGGKAETRRGGLSRRQVSRGARVQLTLVHTHTEHGPMRPDVAVPLADLDDLDVALDAAYECLAASVAGDGGRALCPQEQFQVWQGTQQAGTKLGTLTILPRPDCFFEYRAEGAAEG